MIAKVWVLGDAVVDLLPESEGRLLRCPGGAPANVAVGIARLGGISGFIGRVGDDPFGRFMRHTLQQELVDVSHMRLDGEHRTSTVVVDLDDQGERTFTFMVRPSADLFWRRRPAAVCRQPVAARLLYRAQRRTQPQHHLRGYGENQAGRRPGQL